MKKPGFRTVQVVLAGLGGVCVLLLIGGCATSPAATQDAPTLAPAADARDAQPPELPAQEKLTAADAPPPSGPAVAFTVTLSDVIGQQLSGRTELIHIDSGHRERVPIQNGRVTASLPAGDYRCYTYVHYNSVPVLIDVQDITLQANKDNSLAIALVEGASPTSSILSFDTDGDLAIDRVELDAGTDPYNAASIPGKPLLPFNSPVLSPKAAWYKGELFTHSVHGDGTESVAQLIKRAENAGLDFLAITDRNTLASIHDSGYKSNKLVLIPAMEWGHPDMGFALIYGLRTEPEPPSTFGVAQAECLRVQAQGGIFAIAHPCLPSAPWQWGLSYVNAVQVWLREWRDVPPLALENLVEAYHVRDAENRLVHSIAAAAATTGLSANGQAAQFWDYELVRESMSTAIGGSGSGSPGVPLGVPVTYVYAKEKSLEEILEGLRTGRTYISRDVNGPNLFVQADVGGDGSIEVTHPGGVLPMGNDVVFEIGVSKASGMKLQVLLNGYPILTKRIEGEMFVHRLHQRPDHYGVYRFRVIDGAEDSKDGFGFVDVVAMTSPIYVQNTMREALIDQSGYPTKGWISIQHQAEPEVGWVPPTEGRTLTPVIMQ
jgi:hypothetical protein